MGEAVAQKLVVPEWLRGANTVIPPAAGREAFLDKTLGRISGLRRWFFEETSGRRNKKWLNSIDPAARLGGVLILIVGAAVAGNWQGLGAVALFTIVSAVISGLSLKALVKRALPIFIFTFIVILPLFFDISAVRAGHGWSGLFHVGLSAEGVWRGSFFLFRSTLMALLVVMLGLSMTSSEFLCGLKKFPLPSLFVTVFFITLSNISRLLGILEDAVLAKKARSISGGKVREMEGWFAERVRYLMERAMRTSEEVAMAMTSRGFDGKLRTLGTIPLQGRDFACIGICAFVSIMALLL